MPKRNIFLKVGGRIIDIYSMFIKIFIKYYLCWRRAPLQCCRENDGRRSEGLGGRDDEALALCRPTQGIVTGSYRLIGVIATFSH